MMVIAGKQESSEEHRVRITLPNKRFEVGRCPYDCIDLKVEKIQCGCGEHILSGKRLDVVHLFGRHWNASCAFTQLAGRIKAVSDELHEHTEAWAILSKHFQPPHPSGR